MVAGGGGGSQDLSHALYQKPSLSVLFRKDPSIRREAELQNKLVVVRDTNSRREDFEGPEGRGYTEQGCDRCGWAVRFGWHAGTTLSHSVECRGRMREAIRRSGDAGKRRVEAYEARQRLADAANGTEDERREQDGPQRE